MLQKLRIVPEAPLEAFNVMFNPERYTVNKGVQIAEIGIPGLDSPILQFVRGQNESPTCRMVPAWPLSPLSPIKMPLRRRFPAQTRCSLLLV